MRFTVLTLFPQMIESGMRHSIIGRGLRAGLFSLETINIRDYAGNKWGHVDDTPYGGGAGMVMRAEPVVAAYEAALSTYTGEKPVRTIMTTPRGKPFNQAYASGVAGACGVIIICGHYEGIDERAAEIIKPEEISLGDFVLTGGELVTMAIIDAVARLLPGVLGNKDSAGEESFSGGALEYPQYTKPYEFRGLTVPDVLISGHHANIDKWRHMAALEKTAACRPDLLFCNNTTYNGRCGKNA